jgi:hypothetical protein|tara:strand:- start:188 stop:487 length:300 start_codon:yes stop_codon:yes gene_type:complete
VEIAQLISDYGFPVVMAVGLGYFIYFIWKFIGEHIDPALEEMHFALIRVIDKTRMLDQDMIRLQQKVNVVLEYRARQEVLKDAEAQAALEELEKEKKKK